MVGPLENNKDREKNRKTNTQRERERNETKERRVASINVYIRDREGVTKRFNIFVGNRERD